jgi:hypothetical protein
MRIRRRLTAIARRVVAAAVAAIVCTVGPAAAYAEPAAGLCAMSAERGAVPDDFPIAACVDGSDIWLRNLLQVPIGLAVTGDTGTPVTLQPDQGIAAIVTRSLRADALLLMPSDTMRIPVGRGAATVRIANTDAGGVYLVAVTLATFLPFPAPVAIHEAFADLVRSTADALAEYRDCLVGRNWIGQIGCRATLVRQLDQALLLDSARVVLQFVPPARLLALLLDSATYLKFVEAQAPAIERIADSARTITQSASVSPATDTDWRNTTYRTTCAGLSDSPLTVAVHNGVGSVARPDGVPGATFDFAVAGRPAAGDLTGDGRPEAAVVLLCHQSDTSPNFIVWEIQVFTDGSERLAALMPEPEPGFWRMDFTAGRLSITGGRLRVGVGLYGNEDCNACGPSVQRELAWRWNGHELIRA